MVYRIMFYNVDSFFTIEADYQKINMFFKKAMYLFDN